MAYATLNEEKKLWRKGYRAIACIDEAGRGPLAGPVVAAAVIQNTKYLLAGQAGKILNTKIRDSKQLSAKQRERFYKLITGNKNIKWGIGTVSEKVIDKINILEATKLAMKKAVENISKKSLYHKSYDRTKCGMADFLILDGKMELDLKIPQKSIVKADEKVFSCAAASIIAKVTRDKIMERHHKKYPTYRFDLHKGYGTKLHIKMLKHYGPCEIHRRSFASVLKAKS